MHHATAYSDFLDKDMTKPGPKFLPLGSSFQELVAFFRLACIIVHNNSHHTLLFSDSDKNKLLKQLE